MDIDLRKPSLTLDGKRLLHEVDLTIASGDFLLIRGPSGSGKTSFLRLLNRLREPTSGEIHVDGRSISDHPVTGLRRRIAYLQQTPITLDTSVRENLCLGFDFRASEDDAPSDESLARMLEDFLLTDVALQDEAPNLSVGQKQRIALIRLLLSKPNVLLCDEATSALDPDSRTVVEQELESLNEGGMTVICVTHLDYTPQSSQLRQLTLADGNLVEDRL